MRIIRRCAVDQFGHSQPERERKIRRNTRSCMKMAFSNTIGFFVAVPGRLGVSPAGWKDVSMHAASPRNRANARWLWAQREEVICSVVCERMGTGACYSKPTPAEALSFIFTHKPTIPKYTRKHKSQRQRPSLIFLLLVSLPPHQNLRH